MYLCWEETGKIFVSGEPNHGVVRVNPPVCREKGERREIPLVNWEGPVFRYADEENLVELTCENRTDSLLYLKRTWKNCSDKTRKIQTVFSVEGLFDAERYLIPCVSVNGNEFGQGGEPKGLTRNGESWVFAYDRTPIPACTVVENQEWAVCLFASEETKASLEASCSLVRTERSYRQELLHPVMKTPLTYQDRDVYSPGYETFLTLEPGAVFECGIWLSVSKPMWPNFGIAAVLDDALTLYEKAGLPEPDRKRIWKDSITFAKSLITEYKGKNGFIIGYTLTERGFEYRGDNCFELAWCGQNVLFCRMLIEDYRKTGCEESLRLALEILDTRVACCTAETGLMAGQLRDFENLPEAVVDTCNEGYGAYELLRCYETLGALGIERQEYLDTARGVCEFFRSHYSEEWGFGKAWKLDGTCVGTGGTIGAFVIPALCKLYALTKENQWLELAKKAMEFYVDRDLCQFTCTAGALDTDCVDKETSEPLIIGSVLLYELTKDPKYLEYGKMAAYYFTAWMYHYQPVYGEDTDFARYGIQVPGFTSVSAQHHHLDSYAALSVPYLRRLAVQTGDDRWRIRAEMMWRASLQGISDGTLVVHGHLRPVGSQHEASFHCRWGFREEDPKGKLGDWLVAWPCAFRLSVLAAEEREDF